MAAFGYSLTAIEDIPLSDSIANLFANQGGRTLAEPSLVVLALNAEDVDVSAGIRVGSTEVLSALSRVTLQATVGVLPILPDDIIAQTFAQAGDEIIVSGNNNDAAAARELRGIVFVIPVNAVSLMKSVQPFSLIQ